MVSSSDVAAVREPSPARTAVRTLSKACMPDPSTRSLATEDAWLADVCGRAAPEAELGNLGTAKVELVADTFLDCGSSFVSTDEATELRLLCAEEALGRDESDGLIGKRLSTGVGARADDVVLDIDVDRAGLFTLVGDRRPSRETWDLALGVGLGAFNVKRFAVIESVWLVFLLGEGLWASFTAVSGASSSSTLTTPFLLIKSP